ncbi:mitochondrial carrier [Dendrothele bispora CBS 962.96]|uniref:Mitochondrial carrier n=1 Tax=Dendrothele bispora (strain CBS 962.96) TaxID=1314807 RepID=A0A4S8M6E9_DENBC|nr:mitochondrial carrier [Dendrothele bispora CBS 962.96]
MNHVELNPTVDFIAGTMGGISSLVVGFPFDTVKVRFQNPQFQDKYRSTFHALTTIVREERFVGLFRGITSPLAATALMNGLVFSSYRFFLKLQLENNDAIPTLSQIALAGTGCGIVTSVITTPTELIKIRQQSLSVHTSATQVALDIVRRQGVKGLYRGMTATALRDCGYGAYFWAYEATLRFFASRPQPIEESYKRHHSETSALVHEFDHQPNQQSSWSVLLFAGAMAGIAGWLFTFPLDVVKTRVQGVDAIPTYGNIHAHGTLPIHSGLSNNNVPSSSSSYPPSHSHSRHTNVSSPPTHSSPLLGTAAKVHTSAPAAQDTFHHHHHHHSNSHPYQTTWSTIVNSYRAEGVRVFFRGLAPTLIRAIPVNMATFATFEAVVGVLG